ncbi:MAG: hypothetical protein ACKVP7_11100 [Hyphomicrobiaceae bacterium]
MDINTLQDLAFRLLPHIPSVLVVMVAAVVALARRYRHPKVTDLIIAFAVIEVVLFVVSTIVYMQVPAYAAKAGYGAQDLQWIFAVVGFVHAMIYAGALALLLWAALGWRGESKAP